MTTIITIYGICLMLIGLVCIYNLVNYIRYYSQFKAFNDNIKDWARELDSSMRIALERQAAIMLKEVDERISAQKEQEEDSDAVDSSDADNNNDLINLNENGN